MSTTWSSFLSLVREELSDAGTTPRWSDAVLHAWACDGIRDYSLTLPRRTNAVLTISGASYPLPADYLGTAFVECPTGTTLTRRTMAPGHQYQSRNAIPTQFWIDGTDLYLNGPAPDDDPPTLHYHAVHEVPSDPDDGSFAFTVPDIDIELIRLYVRARAMEQLRSKQSLLDRFKTGTGGRDDNPLSPEVTDLMLDYERKLAERVGGGVIRLWRPGNQ
jgi:hypothetical protein